MDLSPDVLRAAQFTERFRGYDAAEVDAFLSEAADALEEYLAEQSAPMAAVAAESARLAIEEVRRDGLAAVEEMQRRRDDLAEAVADLRRVLADRRHRVVEELAMIDEALTGAADDAVGAATGADLEPDTFLARLEQIAVEENGPDSS